jgi:dihydrofolate synthase/folylpolyglutamate synthase
MTRIPSLRPLEKWLDSFLNFERLPQKNIFWLDTMEFLCAAFDNPQNHGKTVHVAGSKGKGSVSVMMNRILHRAGFSCGLYTSPHILDFAERIGDGEAAYPDTVYAPAAQELIREMEAIPPEDFPGKRPVTWFELVTLFAFLVFRNAKTGWTVYETGLGGRLDATNVLSPAISVITSIELEHTEYLGNTLEAIAAEKGGIIKQGTPVISAPQCAGVRQVFEHIATEKQAPLIFVDDALTAFKTETTLRGERVFMDSPFFRRPVQTTLSLYGAFQGQNAALAALTAKQLLPGLDEGIIEAGLAEARLPGRFQIIRHPPAFPGIPALVLDGAHTASSVSQCVRTFTALFPGSVPALIFACAGDKNAEALASLFAGFAPVTLTRPGNAKQSDPARLQAAFRTAGISFRYDDDYERAIAAALADAGSRGATALVTGSFYLVAEALKVLIPA